MKNEMEKKKKEKFSTKWRRMDRPAMQTRKMPESQKETLSSGMDWIQDHHPPSSSMDQAWH